MPALTRRRPSPRSLARVAFLVAAALVAGCGGGGPASSQDRALDAAEHPSAADFPPAAGRTLQQLGDTVRSGPDLALGSSVLVPGTNRLAFALIGKNRRFLYGRTAVYVARSGDGRAAGPFLAPADSMVPDAPFRSRTAAAETSAVKAIYAAQVPFKRPGRYYVLALTRQPQGIVGAATPVDVERSTRIPAVGDRPPRVSTDTLASVGGDERRLDTRDPPDDMHRADFHDVLGRRPVALLMATPKLCQSRVCGPVTDIELQMERAYGDRMTFIHQEVYVDNDLRKGLRPPLRAFHLTTEPWLFTFGRDGRVAARLEGAFGVRAFRGAVEAALR